MEKSVSERLTKSINIWYNIITKWLRNSLISDYLKYIVYLEKWNGEMPDDITDGASVFSQFNRKEKATDFRRFFVVLLKTVLFLEFINASACVYKLLFTWKVGVTFIADFNLDCIGIFGCTGLECFTCGEDLEMRATSTYNSFVQRTKARRAC